MKIIYTFLLLFCFTLAPAQSFNRMMVEGQIIVPSGDDPEGIVVFNATSQSGTITNRNGIFFLNVRLNDEVVVQSVQFASIKITVDRGMIQNKKMTITLHENLTQLDEIVLKETELTGNIEVDVNRVSISSDTPSVNVPPSGLRTSVIDDASPVPNDALDTDDWKYGLDFVNIFKAIFGKRTKDGNSIVVSAHDELSMMYDNAFFKRNLNIDEKNIGAFMTYVADNGLTKQMMQQGNELNLIQFLLEKKEMFKPGTTSN